MADHGSISFTLGRHFAAEVVRANGSSDALDKLRQQPFDLVLVNRVLDQDGSPGLELIRQMKGDDALHTVPVMLVSNYEDAQRDAVAAGALPGFGKDALGRPPMLERVNAVLQSASGPTTST